jgi:murein hydrolase activator
MRCLLAAAAVWLALQGGAAAQGTDTVIAARRASQDLANAAVALQEAEGARDRVAALTQTVRAYEAGLSALREGVRRAALREAELRGRLEERRADISRLTGALSAIRQNAGPVGLLHPTGPLGSARAGMMLADITPALATEAEDLARELDEVALLRSLQEGAQVSLAAGLSGAQEARTRLSQAIAERTTLPRRYADDPQALAALVEGADTLDSYAAGLTAVPLAGETAAQPAFRSLRGSLPLPADGRVVRGFGDRDAAGVTRPGLVIEVAPLSLVTSPAGATVRHAGPLGDYGNVILLEPAAGYLLVLAGLGEVYVVDGDVVTAGAPLGLAGGREPAAEEFIAREQVGGGGERAESLYLELRENAAPVDPGAWFSPERG